MTNNMSPLSSARRQANVKRRRNLNTEIKRLKQYYSGSFTGQLGRTANVRAMAAINNMMRELGARRIQSAVRRRQATARAHTRARAPLNNVLAEAFSPRRIGYLMRTYGTISNKH
jgi:anti-sigma factor RsiW